MESLASHTKTIMLPLMELVSKSLPVMMTMRLVMIRMVMVMVRMVTVRMVIVVMVMVVRMRKFPPVIVVIVMVMNMMVMVMETMKFPPVDATAIPLTALPKKLLLSLILSLNFLSIVIYFHHFIIDYIIHYLWI